MALILVVREYIIVRISTDLLLFSIYPHATIALQGYLWHRCGKLRPLDGVNHMGSYEFIMMLFLMVCILNLINKNK